MNIINFNELKEIMNKNGFKAVKTKTTFNTEIVKITLEKGAVVPTHTTPVDVIFFILKGTAIIKIGEEEKEAVKGNMIESPKDIPHSLYNKSDEEMEVLVIKLY